MKRELEVSKSEEKSSRPLTDLPIPFLQCRVRRATTSELFMADTEEFR